MSEPGMWAVGDEDGEGWIAVTAADEQAARLAYAQEHDEVRDDGSISPRIVAIRVPPWDALPGKPSGADWLKAGLSYTCDRDCGGMATLDDGGKIINGEPVCGYCIEHSDDHDGARDDDR